MERLLLSKFSKTEDRLRILRLRTIKSINLRRFSPEVQSTLNRIFDELLCEIIFQVHMELSTSVADPFTYDSDTREQDPSLSYLGEDLNIIKLNQDIDCPKCFVLVKCIWFSKHLAGCMNPHQSTYSYSSRNSSRIARQRIQEGFKTSYDESKNDSDDEKVKQVKPKRRNNKGRRNKIRT